MPTTVIRSDRVRFSALTADPLTCVAGDTWLRADVGQLKFAVDTVVANARVTVEAPITTGELADSAVTTAKIADAAVIGGKIAALAVDGTRLADSAVATAKIVDAAVTDAKLAAGISPGKVAAGNMNLGTGTLTAGQVTVGDLAMKYDWRITETPNALLFVQGNKVVGRISKAGFTVG